jgi:hypothetical protein
MRQLDYSDSRSAKGAQARKATDMPKPSSGLSGVTLWGTQVGSEAPPTPNSRPTSRSNHYQNAESPTNEFHKRLRGHNHQQNVETSPVNERRKLTESRINQSHLSARSPVCDKSPKPVSQSRINSSSIVFGASDEPKRAPPPRVEPFQETPRRGHVRQLLPGFTDAGKFNN